MQIKRKGLLLIISSPSGVGKTTLTRLLCAEDKNLLHSISVTTRPKRSQEVEGKDYLFISAEQFASKIEENYFLEYANVYGNWYGTPKQWVKEELAKGRDIIFDIDWQGTVQLVQQMADDIVSIFLLPPSLSELKRRLYSRAQDSNETIEKRIEKTWSEIIHYPSYDYVLVNEDIQETQSAIKAILSGERLKRKRQLNLVDIVHHLKQEV